jgi:AcrR family transcriptional regulator
MPDNQKSRGSDRCEQILEEAAQIFKAFGYDGTSLNMVAERLGLTKMGLYYHYKSKQELLYAIMDRSIQHLEEHALSATVRASSNEERLRQMITRHAELITLENQGASSTLVTGEAKTLKPDDQRVIKQRIRNYFEVFRAVIAQLKEEGKVRQEIDPTVATFSLLGMVVWISKWYRHDGRLSAEEIVSQVTDLAMTAVLGKIPRDHEHRDE